MKYKNACITLLTASLVLTGCKTLSPFSDDTPKHKKPAKLTEITPAMVVRTAWSTRLGGGSQGEYLRLRPASADNTIYTVDAVGQVVASDAKTGKRLWVKRVWAPVTSGPSVSGKLVFLGTSDARLMALNSQSGDIVWEAPMSNEVLAAPVASGDKVYVKSIDGMLTALHRDTGKRVWHYKHESPKLILRASSSPNVADNIVVVGFADGKLDALNASTGSLIWQRSIATNNGTDDVSRMVDIDTQPLISDGIIYVASYQGNVAALSLMSGQMLWRRKLSTYSNLALEDNKLFATDVDGNVYALSADSGRTLWKQEKLRNRGLTAPVVMGRALVVGDKEGYVHWLSLLDGHFLNRKRIDKSGILAAPRVAGNRLYVGAGGGRLTALMS